MTEAVVFLTSASLAIVMLSGLSMFAVGVIVIWESIREPLVQLWKWVRP